MKKIIVECLEIENEKEVVKTEEIDIVEKSPIVKSSNNDYPFMDNFTSKANDTIEKIVDKLNNKASYFDKEKNKPKSFDTIKQAVKRDNTRVSLLVVIGKLLNKSTLNKNDVDVLVDFATYNNKSKIEYDIFEGMKYGDFIKKYPRVSYTKVMELCDINGLFLNPKTRVFEKL